MRKVRPRYVVFKIHGDVASRSELIRTLNGLRVGNVGEGMKGFERLWLVFFEDNVGIVRCPHLLKDRVVEQINEIQSIEGRNVDVKTIGSAGTIRSALSKFVKPNE
jgi:RNase P/RNase MRP subunit POP5